jgi:hypothetical protein
MNDPAKHTKRLRDVYRACFCGQGGDVHQAGIEVLSNLRQMTGYGTSPFTNDALTMAHRVGQQDVIRHIQLMLNIPDSMIYQLMHVSNHAEDSFAND